MDDEPLSVKEDDEEDKQSSKVKYRRNHPRAGRDRTYLSEGGLRPTERALALVRSFMFHRK